MPASSEKRFLRGICAEPGCTKRVRHLRGYADVRVAWVDYNIKALCGEHTREWDEKRKVWNDSLPSDNPNHLIPSSSIYAYHRRAERLAAEQEAFERALKEGRTMDRPISGAVQERNARAPRVVRLS